MNNTIDELPAVLTPYMVSQILMIGLNSTYLLLRSGEIKSVRIGKQYRISKHDLVSGSFIPPADIRQLRDLVRYRWKLTNFTTGEKNRAQNCLTVSNIKLDDVFSDVFGKAAAAITTRLLENPSEKITDVSGFRTKGMKATNEEVLAAVDGELCVEQAEKLRIIETTEDSV